MKQFFGEMAAFTNEFDVAAQSERAYNLFVTDYQRGQSEEQDI